MLDDFFKLNRPYETFNEARMASQLSTSKHVCNVLYQPEILSPETLSKRSVENIKFENVSFAKTTIKALNFKKCEFMDCLFIGTEFTDGVRFHDCKFINCNFFASKFIALYGKPHQFQKAITDQKYANIAVHLYQQLTRLYSEDFQRSYKNEAAYNFLCWKRVLDYQHDKRDGKGVSSEIKYFISWCHDFFFGYGYHLRNIFLTTAALIIFSVLSNHIFYKYLFSSSVQPSFIKSVYLTITTMATLGASGYAPDTDIGFIFVTVNVLIGITILAATINAIFNRVTR